MQTASVRDKQNIFLDLLGGVTKPGLVPAWRHPNTPRPRRDEPRPDPLDHVERNHEEDDETGRIRHRPVSPSERLLSTELVPIMPLYAVATGPILGRFFEFVAVRGKDKLTFPSNFCRSCHARLTPSVRASSRKMTPTAVLRTAALLAAIVAVGSGAPRGGSGGRVAAGCVRARAPCLLSQCLQA